MTKFQPRPWLRFFFTSKRINMRTIRDFCSQPHSNKLMNASHTTVDHDECLTLFAELGGRVLELQEEDATIPGDDERYSELLPLRGKIDTAIRLESWGEPNVLESIEALFSTAVGHEDDRIAAGITSYLDYLAGIQIPQANSEGKSLTFGIVCCADMTGFDQIGAFPDVARLTSWVAKHLAVPESTIAVHPVPGMPDTILGGAYEFMAEMGRTMTAPLPEEFTWVEAEEKQRGYATDIVFWVNYSNDDVIEMQRVADLIGYAVDDEKIGMLQLPYISQYGDRALDIYPCAVQWPFSACEQSVFNPVLDAFEAAVTRLEARGYSASQMTAEINMSSEEGNPYGCEESFVIELREDATGVTLARIPGFDAWLAEMFLPYLGCAALAYRLPQIVFRPGNGEPNQSFDLNDD